MCYQSPFCLIILMLMPSYPRNLAEAGQNLYWFNFKWPCEQVSTDAKELKVLRALRLLDLDSQVGLGPHA